MTKTPNNQAGLLRSLWIMCVAALYIANTCCWAIFNSATRKNCRSWVNQILNRWVVRTLKLFRITCTVHNPYHIEPQPGQPTIIMCNHSSLLDIPISLCAFPNHPIRMLAKKEMGNIPLMKQAMIASEFPFVDRKNRNQAIRDLEAVKKLLTSGIVMWIAPEGTRSHDGHVGPFKKGAFISAIQTKAKIIPIGIRGAFNILPARTWRFNLNQHAEVHVGQPIDASLFTLENKEELIQQVRQSIQHLADDHDKNA